MAWCRGDPPRRRAYRSPHCDAGWGCIRNVSPARITDDYVVVKPSAIRHGGPRARTPVITSRAVRVVVVNGVIGRLKLGNALDATAV